MERVDRKKLEALKRVITIGDVLIGDVLIVGERFQKEVLAHQSGDRQQPNDSPDWEMAFLGKTAARVVFGLIDGISYAMREATVDLAQEVGLEVAEKKKLELQEKRIDREGKMVYNRLSPLESLKLAFKFYPQLFGVEFKLDTGGEHWKALRGLADARNRFTHPERLEDLLGRKIFQFWFPAYTWMLSQVGELFDLCAQSIPGSSITARKADVARYMHAGDEGDIFSEQDYELIMSDSLRTLEYTKRAFEVLTRDTSRAMDFSSRLSSLDSLLGRHGQCGLRNWVRTFFSEVEGTVEVASFFIRASAFRKEFDLTADDSETLGGELEIDDRLVRVMNLWSREFGAQKRVELGGTEWREFRKAMRLRNRLTHPKSERDLRVSLEDMDTIIKADGWVRNVAELLYLDASAWAVKAR